MQTQQGVNCRACRDRSASKVSFLRLKALGCLVPDLRLAELKNAILQMEESALEVQRDFSRVFVGRYGHFSDF